MKYLIMCLFVLGLFVKDSNAQTYPPGHYNWGHVPVNEGQLNRGGQIQRSRGRDYTPRFPAIGSYGRSNSSGWRDRSETVDMRLKAMKARKKVWRQKQQQRLELLRKK